VLRAEGAFVCTPRLQSLTVRRLDRLLWGVLVLLCTLQALDPEKSSRLRAAVALLLYAPVGLAAAAAVARWRWRAAAKNAAMS
jgi:hypothetical protein